MAETWYPNPGVTQLQHEHLIGVAVPTGVVGHPQDPSLVYAPGSGTREIRFRADRRAAVLGYGWANDNDEIVRSLADNAAGEVRVDLAVLRFDRADYSVRNAVVLGTPGAGAPAPTMDTGTSGVWELPVAEVDVSPGATTIADTQVRNRAWYIGPDGGYLCTSSTRPPHSPGRRIWETDTGRQMVSDGVRWLVAAEDAISQVLLSAANWTASGQFNHLRRRNGAVHMALTPQRIAGPLLAGQTSSLGTIPAGFWPTEDREIVGHVVSSGAAAVGLITTTGLLTVRFWRAGINTGRYLNLQSASWPVAH